MPYQTDEGSVNTICLSVQDVATVLETQTVFTGFCGGIEYRADPNYFTPQNASCSTALVALELPYNGKWTAQPCFVGASGMRVNGHNVFGNIGTKREGIIRSYSVPENTMKQLFPRDGFMPLKSSSGATYRSAPLPILRQSSAVGAASHEPCYINVRKFFHFFLVRKGDP